MATTIARKADESTALWVLGGLYEVKVSSEESDGALTVMQMTVPPGYGPPPHVHNCTEVVYVVEGALTYHIGDETVEGTAGSVFAFPEGVTEWFEAANGKPVTVLATYAPGGIDKFFTEIGEPALSRTIPPPATEPPDFERIVQIAARHGMTIAAP